MYVIAGHVSIQYIERTHGDQWRCIKADLKTWKMAKILNWTHKYLTNNRSGSGVADKII